MKFRNLVAATAALSLAASPAIAQSAVSADRASAPVEGESKLNGGSSVVLAILAAAAVIAGIVIAVDGGDDDPVSV